MNRRSSHQTEERSAEDVLAELKDLVQEAEGMISDMSKPGAESRLRDIRESIDHATERLQNGYVRAQESVRKSAQDADKLIRGNPYKSMAAGIGLGLLVGLLLQKRK